MIWTLRNPQRLHWHNFASEWLLFDQATGQTVLMNNLSAGALMALELSDLSIDLIQRQVSEDCGIPESPDLRAEVLDCLSFLQTLGLVEQRVS